VPFTQSHIHLQPYFGAMIGPPAILLKSLKINHLAFWRPMQMAQIFPLDEISPYRQYQTRFVTISHARNLIDKTLTVWYILLCLRFSQFERAGPPIASDSINPFVYNVLRTFFPTACADLFSFQPLPHSFRRNGRGQGRNIQLSFFTGRHAGPR
jgi:hypothetical protein